MGFDIGYDLGPLGGLVAIVGLLAAVIVVIFLLRAAKMARDDVVETDRDHGKGGPIA